MSNSKHTDCRDRSVRCTLQYLGFLHNGRLLRHIGDDYATHQFADLTGKQYRTLPIMPGVHSGEEGVVGHAPQPSMGTPTNNTTLGTSWNSRARMDDC